MQLKVFGYKLKISFLFVAVSSALIILDETNIALLGIISAVIHETGHLFVMKKFGCPATEIYLDAFNISIIDYNKIKQTYYKEIIILLSGSFLNLIIAFVFYLIYLLLPYKIIMFFVLENLFIALFNLLPICSLDGGQILRITLNKRLTEKKSNTILVIISFVSILPILIAGFYILIESKHNFSLLLLSVYLIVVLLLKKDITY